MDEVQARGSPHHGEGHEEGVQDGRHGQEWTHLPAGQAPLLLLEIIIFNNFLITGT